MVVVAAVDEDQAKQKVLKASPHRLGSKLYLTRDWKIREATEEDIRVYSGQADNWRPSQTPERQHIEARRRHGQPRRTTQQRLL
jgi:hypothetical protein